MHFKPQLFKVSIIQTKLFGPLDFELSRFHCIKFWYLSYFCSKHNCGYSLEPPRRGGSNEFPQSMFLSRNKKNNVYPCKAQFYYIKVGFKGVKIIQACFREVYFVHLWFHTWHLFWHYLFLISPSFGALGGLCFVIVAFPGYLHLYSWLVISTLLISNNRLSRTENLVPV